MLEIIFKNITFLYFLFVYSTNNRTFAPEKWNRFPLAPIISVY